MSLGRFRRALVWLTRIAWSRMGAVLAYVESVLLAPTYKVKGQIKVQADVVRVELHHQHPVRTLKEDGMDTNSTNKGVPGKMRGARPSAPHKLAAAFPFIPELAPPPQFAIVPKQLSMWGNDRYGDCVSAEEAFAKACYSPEIFIADQVVIQWAGRNGFLNGADLSDVLDAMRENGFSVPPSTYDDGDKQAVDYSNEAVLQAAIALGPVKIAIDADALPSGAGNQQGWVATGQGRYPNTDHCVSLCGYGPAGWLFQQLGIPLPSKLQPTQTGYLLFTWSTIGFVDHAWLMGTCTEAWVRNPTTVILGPGPTPPNPPTPPSPPSPVSSVGQLVLTQPLQPGSYPIAPGVALVVGNAAAINWQTILQIIIAILNGLVPVIPSGTGNASLQSLAR